MLFTYQENAIKHKIAKLESIKQKFQVLGNKKKKEKEKKNS